MVRRYVDAGAAAGVSATAAARIARAAIDESVEVQGRVPRSAEPMRICIVGGNGAMGRWLSAFFAGRGHAVTVTVLNPKDAAYPVTSIAEACRTSKVIVVSTPVTDAPDVLEEIFALGTDALVFDILSVKTPVSGTLKRMADARMQVCSVHPMFGPSAGSVAGRNVVVADCGSAPAADAAAELFAGGTMCRMTIDEHDPAAAYVLGMAHAVNLGFSEALVRSGFSSGVLNSCASTTFRKQIAVSREVSEENAAPYYAIQRQNPYNDTAVKNLADAVVELGTLDEEGFCRRMKTGAAWYRE